MPCMNSSPTPRTILLFWIPLALQWMMMALEGPFLAAVIARLPDPTFNLAAYGVAFAFAILVESPVIMLMSASTALVEDAMSYRRLRNFAWALNLVSTVVLLILLVPGVHGFVMRWALGLPEEVAGLTRGALWLLLPWPAAIGYRRFLHGVLIRSGRTRRVAYGTGVRLLAMGMTALTLAASGLPGVWVGAAALSAGVVVEALAAHWMAREAVMEVKARSEETPTPAFRPVETSGAGVSGSGPAVAVGRVAALTGSAADTAPGYGAIVRFYYPLALTSFIGLTTQPILTFFMGRSPAPVESLALFPVVMALAFVFNTLGLSFQEAAIALVGRHREHARVLGRFAAALGVTGAVGMGLIAFSPLTGVWFQGVSGLPPELAEQAVTPARVAVILPLLSVALAFQRALLVQARTTRPITLATVLEVGGIALFFPLFGWGLGLMGVTAALWALVGGRILGAVFLSVWTRRV